MGDSWTNLKSAPTSLSEGEIYIIQADPDASGFMFTIRPSMPDSDTAAHAISAGEGVKFRVEAESVWVKSEYETANLIISEGS